jgi:hypothetical protein
LFHFGLLSIAGHKVSIVQYKVLHPFHRLSFTSKCYAHVPCHKLCHKLTSSSHDLVLFLKMSCSVFKIFSPLLPQCLVWFIVFCLWSSFPSYCCSLTFRNRYCSLYKISRCNPIYSLPMVWKEENNLFLTRSKWLQP